MNQSEQYFEEAKKVIPGGVNSPVRCFYGVGGTPVFFQRGEGAYLIDVDNKRYIDYTASWGPLILGHRHPDILDAVITTLQNGLSFGAPTPLETELAKKVTELMPSIEKIRMVNSGTEATMSAIRLARGFTGRDKIIKFNGCYHGHSDALLVNAGSGALTLGIPSSPGVPKDFVKHTLVAEFNDINSVEQIFSQHADDIAAIIIEPIAGNMGCIPAEKAFLQGLRELCDKHKSILIFDEVITGFRVGSGGAQAYYDVKPDLTTLGKIIGGGMPVGAFGGSAEIMSHLAPEGPVYQAGTLSGNPVAMAAGLCTLEIISQPGFYDKLEKLTENLVVGLIEKARAANIPFTALHIGSMFGFTFTTENEIKNYEQVKASNIKQFQQFYHAMLEQGIYFGPSAFETSFISNSHTQQEIDKTLAAAEQAFSSLSKGDFNL